MFSHVNIIYNSSENVCRKLRLNRVNQICSEKILRCRNTIYEIPIEIQKHLHKNMNM